MVEGLVEGLMRGSKLSWGLVAGLWILTAVLVAVRRGGLAGVFALLGATTATSIAALPLAAAVAVPRIRWKTVPSTDLAAATGDTWRRLRGPAVEVIGPGGVPDIAIPVLDASGRWVLFGLIEGAPVPGIPPAVAGKIEVGVPRICQTEGDACRPWPASWPDPSRPMALGESIWTREGSSGALAYDVETRLYLRDFAPPEDRPGDDRAGDRPMIELIGRLTTDPPRDGPTALFVVRRIHGSRLQALRVVSAPSPAGAYAFVVQRASVDLELGRKVLRSFARPVLWVTSFALPAGVLAMLLAPLWMAARLRRGAPESAGPGSVAPSRRAVSSWLEPGLRGMATFAAGLAAAAPAVVAIASLWASR